jgi:hypothetical protein
MAKALTPTNIVDDVMKGLTATVLVSRDSGKIKKSDNTSTFFGNISVCIPNGSKNSTFTPQLPTPTSASNSSSSSFVAGKRKRSGKRTARETTPVDLHTLLSLVVRPDAFDPDDNPLYSSRATTYECLPKILFIHINRTSFTATGGVKKIMGHVQFPLNGLDVEGAFSSSSSSSSSTTSSSSYRLYGIVVHHGRAMNQGHFTAYALVGNVWYHFNDHRVTKVKHLNTILGQQAYLLVYQQE